MHIGRTLCLYRADDVERTSDCHPCPPVTPYCRYRYRADEHRVLELLKNLALGRIFQQMQASFRRKMGRVYRQLLRQALHSLGAALAHVKAAPEIGPQEVQQMEYAMQAYHDHLGRFGAIFGEYQPADLVT